MATGRKLGKFDLPVSAEQPIPGTATWRNPHNKVFVYALHYTADPDKATPAWRQQTQQGYSEAGWDQEFELDFSSWEGRPVYSSFVKTVHVAAERLLWTPRLPVLRWWDIGIHAVVWAQLDGGQLSIFTSRQTAGGFGPQEQRYRKHEIVSSGLGIFIERALELSEEMFPDAVFKDVCDPAAWSRTITRQETPVQIFNGSGLHPLPGATQDIDVRIDRVERWLMAMGRPGVPALQIDPTATILIDAFAGGYRFRQEGRDSKPDKNGYSHAMDAIQYGVSLIPVHADHKHRRFQQEVMPKGIDPAHLGVVKGGGKKERPESWLSY
jgi:hypothetical protein